MKVEEMTNLTDIAKNTQNDVIIWTIVLIMGFVIAAIPFFKLFIKWRSTVAAIEEQKRKQDFSDQQLLMGVIQKNSEVIAELKTVLMNTNSKCDICKNEQLTKFTSIDTRFVTVTEKLDKDNLILNEIYTILLERGEK